MNAVSGTVRRLMTLADGTIRLQVDLDPLEGEERKDALATFADVNAPVALARLQDAAAVSAVRPDWGKEASELRKSGFVRVHDVLQALGSDKEYLAWLKVRPCHLHSIACKGQVVAAHVRRVADGAGTGIKPKYSAIPLCNYHHTLQHQKGESAIGGKEMVDRAKARYMEEWGWERLRAELGVESMRDADPRAVWMWAEARMLDRYLPESYRYG